MTFTNFDKLPSASVIRADRKGRLLIRAEQRAAILKAFDDSALSAMAFCRQHSISYSTFATWVQKRRKDANSTELESNALSRPTFAEVLIEERKSAVSPPPPLRVTLRSGVSFEVSSSEQIPLVTELIQSLSSLRPC
jgi:hypothetical protein